MIPVFDFNYERVIAGDPGITQLNMWLAQFGSTYQYSAHTIVVGGDVIYMIHGVRPIACIVIPISMSNFDMVTMLLSSKFADVFD